MYSLYTEVIGPLDGHTNVVSSGYSSPQSSSSYHNPEAIEIPAKNRIEQPRFTLRAAIPNVRMNRPRHSLAMKHKIAKHRLRIFNYSITMYMQHQRAKYSLLDTESSRSPLQIPGLLPHRSRSNTTRSRMPKKYGFGEGGVEIPDREPAMSTRDFVPLPVANEAIQAPKLFKYTRLSFDAII